MVGDVEGMMRLTMPQICVNIRCLEEVKPSPSAASSKIKRIISDLQLERRRYKIQCLPTYVPKYLLR